MSALGSKKVYKGLKRKGFIDSTTKSVDHKYLELYYKDKYVTSTKLSHGKKDIDDYLIKQMSTQCKLEKNEFIELVSCHIEKEDYLKILEKKGLLK